MKLLFRKDLINFICLGYVVLLLGGRNIPFANDFYWTKISVGLVLAAVLLHRIYQNSETSINDVYYWVGKKTYWFIFGCSLAFCSYKIWDSASHMNWPAQDNKNAELIKSFGCNWDKYLLYRKDINEITETTGNSRALNRKIFFEQPQCIAALYLSTEGTGVRTKTKIYDLEAKHRTATIIIESKKAEAN